MPDTKSLEPDITSLETPVISSTASAGKASTASADNTSSAPPDIKSLEPIDRVPCDVTAPKAPDADAGPDADSGDVRKVSRTVVLAYGACAIIWGTTWYGIRASMGPDGYTPYVAAALRFSLASLILLAVWSVRNKQIKTPTKREFAWISGAGLVSGFAYGLLYCAEEHLTGGIAAVISATSPLIAAIIAMSTRTESASKVTLIGSVVSIVGVALVFHDRLQVSPAQASAVGALLGSAAFNSSSNVVMKRQAHKTSALASNALFFSFASVMLWVVCVASGKFALPSPIPVGPTIALLYLTFFGTLLAFAAFFYLLKRVRLSTAMTLSFVCPLVALGIDALLEKQFSLTPESYLGVAVVLTGVALSVLYKVRQEKA